MPSSCFLLERRTWRHWRERSEIAGSLSGRIFGRILSIAENSDTDGDMRCTCTDDLGGQWRVHSLTAETGSQASKTRDGTKEAGIELEYIDGRLTW